MEVFEVARNEREPERDRGEPRNLGQSVFHVVRTIPRAAQRPCGFAPLEAPVLAGCGPRGVVHHASLIAVIDVALFAVPAVPVVWAIPVVRDASLAER